MGRFLMNLMMAPGGYPWTVIPVGDRKIYMEALEKASVGEDIVPFADFLSGLVKKGWPAHRCRQYRRLNHESLWVRRRMSPDGCHAKIRRSKLTGDLRHPGCD